MPPKKASKDWPSTKAKRALAALFRIGWRLKRQSGTSHRILELPGWPDILFAYHDRVTLGPTAMKVLAKRAGCGAKICSGAIAARKCSAQFRGLSRLGFYAEAW